MITALTNHLWQSTVVVILVWLLSLALRRNRASVRHALWMAASAKFAVPFSLLIALGAAVSWRSADSPADTPATPAFATAVEQFTEPFAVDAEPSASQVTPRPTMDWTVVLASIWAAGFFSVMAMRIRGWQRIRAAVRASAPLTLTAAEFDRAMDIRSAPGLLEPGVVGIWRPILLVPDGLEAALTADQLHAVFVHEQHHIDRRDNLTSMLHMAVEAVFWFYPLVWWIGARLIDERERACDEHVLAVCGAPEAYAEGIVKVCKRYVESPVACVSGVTGSDLKKRVGAILSNRVGTRLNIPRRVAVGLVAIAVLMAPLVAGMLTAPARMAAQTPGPLPKFEVVSVRPCAADAPGSGRGSPLADASPGRLSLPCYSVLRMIQTAYATYADGRAHSDSELPVVPVPNDHVQSGLDHTGAQGVPDWVWRDRFTIEAKAEGEPTSLVMVGPMLQRVLEDRFKVKVHRETREISVYEMVPAKGGIKVAPVKPGACVPYDVGVSPQPALGAGQHRCSNGNTRDPDGNYVYEFEATTLDDFAASWSKGWVLDRPLVNKTGITGLVSFRLVQSVHTAGVDDARAAMIAEFKNRLGLELRPGKAQREFLIIDHVERPSPNGQITVAASTPAASAEAAAGTQKFDVASIRPCEDSPGVPGGRRGGVGPVFSPGMFVYNCGTLLQLVHGAYVGNGEPLLNNNLRLGLGHQIPEIIRGGPDWARSERWMIEAKAAISTGLPGNQAPERKILMGPMLRALLEDRFKLKLHREVENDIPMYALVVAKGGLKATPFGPDSCTPVDLNQPPPIPMDQEIERVRRGGKPFCGHGIMGGSVGPNQGLVLNGQTMAGLAQVLSSMTDRHVLDRTGIDGKFEMYLEYAKDDMVPNDLRDPAASVGPPTAPSITQVLKSLGLELQPTKGSQEHIVIDHAERPAIGAPLFQRPGSR
ncbi:MAG TPA: M56 family metallopeptidase [Vicinamibacterales bacterium]|nr:M56 family metallopeptidase [Vicinamibacterales bacterium]